MTAQSWQFVFGAFSLLFFCYTALQFLVIYWCRRWGEWNEQIRIYEHGVWHFISKVPIALSAAFFLLRLVIMQVPW